MTEQQQPSGEDWAAAVGQATAAMGLLDATVMVRQATAAYRDRLINEEGFPEGHAQIMAVHFHEMAIAAMQAKAVGAGQVEVAERLAAVDRGKGSR